MYDKGVYAPVKYIFIAFFVLLIFSLIITGLAHVLDFIGFSSLLDFIKELE